MNTYNISDTFLFVFVSRRGLCNPGWPQTLSNPVNLPGARIKGVSHHSQFRHFYVLDNSQWGEKAKILGTVKLLLLCVEETVDYKDHRSNVSESGQGKERGGNSRIRRQETLGKGHWTRAFRT